MFKRITAICLIGILSACSEEPSQQTETPEEDVVIVSEKTIPENFENLLVEGTGVSYNAYYAQKAENEEQVKSLWNTFRMKGEPPKIDFATKDAFFISFYESGSCPKEPKNIQIEGSTLSFSLEEPGGENRVCTDDLSPKTLLLELDSSEINSVLIREGEAETEVPLE